MKFAHLGKKSYYIQLSIWINEESQLKFSKCIDHAN